MDDLRTGFPTTADDCRGRFLVVVLALEDLTLVLLVDELVVVAVGVVLAVTVACGVAWVVTGLVLLYLCVHSYIG